jgi:hypothetical protein
MTRAMTRAWPRGRPAKNGVFFCFAPQGFWGKLEQVLKSFKGK